MLSHLLIKNYALIEELELSPDSRLNIITGETGAGKSILLGAIGLLLGNRADTKTLYDSEIKCVIEGTFEIAGYDLQPVFEEEELDYAEQCVIRREISPAGKSRAFINDTPVNLETLRRVTGQLMDIHSQHDSILLGTSSAQLQILDAYATNTPLLEEFRSNYRKYLHLRTRFTQLEKDAGRIRKEFDYASFLLQELETANLSKGEQETLEGELKILENATEIKERLRFAYDLMESPELSLADQLKSALGSVTQLARLVQEYAPLKDRLQGCLLEVKDLTEEILQAGEKVEIDQERIELVRERLDMIYHLEQKHQVKSVDELLFIKEELDKQVNQALNLDNELSEIRMLLTEARDQMQNSAERLSESRKTVVPAIEEKVTKWLIELGMPNAVIAVDMKITEPTFDGIDGVSFLFSANRGIAPQELRNVASGGEFSRLTLAIKYILADKKKLPTIIFDEIDTGVSGQVAIKMGDMMKDMAKKHQIIAISHLHQIASKGNAHYFVYKDESLNKTMSRIRELHFEERVKEIAEMIGGHNPSELVVTNARELLKQG